MDIDERRELIHQRIRAIKAYEKEAKETAVALANLQHTQDRTFDIIFSYKRKLADLLHERIEAIEKQMDEGGMEFTHYKG